MGHTIRNKPDLEAKEQRLIDSRKDRKFRSKKFRRARRKHKRER